LILELHLLHLGLLIQRLLTCQRQQFEPLLIIAQHKKIEFLTSRGRVHGVAALELLFIYADYTIQSLLINNKYCKI
jgi:hypothetical protein